MIITKLDSKIVIFAKDNKIEIIAEIENTVRNVPKYTGPYFDF